MNSRHEQYLEKTYEARDSYYESVGKPDSDVLGQAIPGEWQGEAAWPTIRKAYRVIRRSHSVIIATDGLADPFEDDDDSTGASGFDLELYIEAEDLATDANVLDGGNVWALELLIHAADEAAGRGAFREWIEKYGCVSMALPGHDLPERWLDQDGNAAILFNVPSPDIPSEMPLPLGRALMVPITLILPDELQLIIEHKAEGRERLRDLLVSSGNWHRIRLNRPSVVSS